MLAQPSICHNTAKPTVCLLSLLYATIQLSLLCACSAFYMPQYSRAYYMPAQPSIVCLLSLLYDTQYSRAYCVSAQPSICHNTIQVLQYNFFFQPAYNTVLSLQYTSSLSFKQLLSHDTLSVLCYNPCQLALLCCNIIIVLQYNFPAKPSCLLQYYFVSCNTIPCLTSAKPTHFKSQYTSNLAIQTLFCNTMGSSPFFHCTKFFFFFRFSLINIFFSILFPTTGNTQKQIHPFFFIQYTK